MQLFVTLEGVRAAVVNEPPPMEITGALDYRAPETDIILIFGQNRKREKDEFIDRVTTRAVKDEWRAGAVRDLQKKPRLSAR